MSSSANIHPRHAWRALVLAALALAAACDGSLERPSIVSDLRVLAMGQYFWPREGEGFVNLSQYVVRLDTYDADALATHLLAGEIWAGGLIVDPGPERFLLADWTFCPPTESLRCDDPEAPASTSPPEELGDPDTEGCPAGVEQCGILMVPRLSREVVRAAVEAANPLALEGVVIQGQLRVWPRGASPDGPETVYASKKIRLVPPIPPERTSNSDPDLLEIRWAKNPEDILGTGRCADPAFEPHVINRGVKVSLQPIEEPGARETYVVPTFDGEVREVTETLSVSWYATAGSFTQEKTGGPADLFGNQPDLDTNWVAPPSPGRVSLWTVVRDERGGTRWDEYCVQVL